MTKSMITRMPALVRRVDELDEVADGAELRQHVGVVADVVAAVAQRGAEERRQPDAVDAQPLDVVELVDQAGRSPVPSPLLSLNERTSTS
jgi:hypothetical protein